MNILKKTRGIMFKTFMFTTALILFVSLVTFGALYVALPKFYLHMKTGNINANLEKLISGLENEADENRAKELIAAFCTDNNSEVIAFNNQDEILSAFSYPLVMLELGDEFTPGVTGLHKMAESPKETQVKEGIEGAEGTDEIVVTEGIQEMGVKVLFNRTHLNRTPDLTIVTSFRQNAAYAGASATMVSKEINSPLISSLTLYSTLQPIDEAQNVVIALIPFLLLADVIIALIAAYFYARTLTGPVLKISRAADLMQDMAPGITTGVVSGDEFGQLGKNLDKLYIQLCSNIESLRSERDKVTELERSKTDFMRAASHELKTPLAALTGILEGMMDNVGVYRDHPKYLAESKNQVERLAALVNEILRAARLEHLHETEKLQDVDIAALLEESLDDYSFAISEKNIRLTVEVQPDESFRIHTDRKILKTTLSNLISNAVKYSEADGMVTVRLEFEFALHKLCLSIENQCTPIPAESIDKLFEPFFVLDYSRGRQKSGTGLGLYIVKRNLEQLQIPYSFTATDSGMRFSMVF